MDELKNKAILHTGILLPENCLIELEKLNEKDFFTFFNRTFVFFAEIRSMLAESEHIKRADELIEAVKSDFAGWCQEGTVIHLDTTEFLEGVKEAIASSKQGINLVKHWYPDIMRTASMLTDLRQEEAVQRKPCVFINYRTYEVTTTSGKYFRTSIIVTNKEPYSKGTYFDELMKKVDEKFKNHCSPKSPKKTRSPLDTRLRHEVFKRDGYKCVECGATKDQKMLHADHIVPVSQGGTDELSNLQTFCDDCNYAKSNKCFTGGKND